MIQKLTIAALIGAFSLGLAACEREGPAERMGERVDEAAESARDTGEEAARELEQAAEDVGQEAEEAADDVRNR